MIIMTISYSDMQNEPNPLRDSYSRMIALTVLVKDQSFNLKAECTPTKKQVSK